MTVGFGGRETLVPQMNRHARLLAERLRKGLSFGGLRTEIPRHIQGISHDDLGAALLAHEPRQGAKVLAAIPSDQRKHGLRSEAQLIGDGDPDSTVANVEPHEAAPRNAADDGRI
jgi:hypothetical protein